MKRIFAFVMSLIMCAGIFSALGAFAENGSSSSVELPEIVYWEDFSEAQRTGEINTSGNWVTVGENNGFFAVISKDDDGNPLTEFDFSNGTFKYVKRAKGDYFDVRLRNGGPIEKDLAQNFILSLKLKPYVSGFNAQFAFSSKEEMSGTVNSSSNGLVLKNGQFYIGSTAAPTTATIPANEWSLIEVAFHYDESAKADNAMYTGGAIDSYTVMLNGEALYTANMTVLVQNFDFFRMFSGAGVDVQFEVDDVRIALGNTSLKVFDENGGVKKESYNKNVSWITDKTSATGYAYSFCIVGDTQMVARYYPDNLANIYDWIVANVESKKIEHVFGLGDITDKSTAAEWNAAKAQINKLNGVVSYSLVRGNHDKAADINTHFCNTTYTSQFEGFYKNGSIENSWKKLDVGEEKYLLITLDDGAKDDVLAWADEIIKANSDRKVIVTTHSYLSCNGDPLSDDVDSDTPAAKNPGQGYNDGIDIWNELLYENANVFMVIGGHIDADRVIQTKAVGKHGNEVIQMLVDPQAVDSGVGPTGMVTMLYFSEDGKTIEVETYSTVRNAFFMEENQFTIDVVEFDLSNINGGDESENTDTGRTGKDGLTPYIGENGNWWIGDTDTGIKVTGENGKDGADGKDGEKGKNAEVSSGGCGSSVGAGMIFVCVAAASACSFAKKKKKR